MNWKEKLLLFYHNVFNLKLALISAIFQGIIAIVVNSGHEHQKVLLAGLAGAISSFFSTGFTARVVQHFSPIRSALISYFLGSLVPATMTFSASLIAHLWNNSPEVLASCIFPTIVSYTTSYVTNYLTRHGRLRPKNYPKL